MIRRAAHRAPIRREEERGSAAVELAVAMPAVLVVLAFCLGGISVAARSVALADATADEARARAIGEAGQGGTVARVVPGATVSGRTEGDLECVDVVAALAVVPGLDVPVAFTSCARGGPG